MSLVSPLAQEQDPHEKAVRLTARERRFIKFASVDFDGQLYMTPQDFLDSVVEQEPRPRLKRKALSPQDINQMKDATPALKNGSTSLFRSLRDKGKGCRSCSLVLIQGCRPN